MPLVDLHAEREAHGEEIMAAIGAVVTAGTFILGPQVAALEASLAEFVQHPDSDRPVHCIGVSDGTAALQMCLMALGVGAGDEVVTVPFTWISSAEVIPLVGATPVFADVERDGFVMDPDTLSPLLTKRTRAVIAVSLFGLIPDLRGIRAVLDEAQAIHGTRIALIEDGAQSFGSVRGGHLSCGSPYATLSTTSFFPTKPLSCYGDGGAVFTQDPLLARAVTSIRVHGRNAASKLHDAIGLNGRLDTLQAAVILTKLAHFPDARARRKRSATIYNELVQGDGRITPPTNSHVYSQDATASSVYGVYTIRVPAQLRDRTAELLRKRGVSCALYYPVCCDHQPVFRDARSACPVAHGASKEVLSLPMHAFLTKEVQTRVVDTLLKALDDASEEKEENTERTNNAV